MYCVIDMNQNKSAIIQEKKEKKICHMTGYFLKIFYSYLDK